MPAAVPRVTLTCEICRSPFQRRQAEIDRAGHPSRYCSAKCRQLGHRNREQVACSECTIAFERPVAEMQRRQYAADGPWCSWKCFRAFQARTGKSYPKIGGRHAHRIVAERMLGRPLTPEEIVHHKDEDKRNFDAHNLDVLPDRSEHARVHFAGVPKTPEHNRKVSAALKARAQRLKERRSA